MEKLEGDSSKCFNLLSPLLKEELIDPEEAFILGHIMKKIDLKQFNIIMNTFEKLLILRRTYQIDSGTLDMISNLILEADWNAVMY